MCGIFTFLFTVTSRERGALTVQLIPIYDKGKEQSPWEGFWVICAVLIVIPFLFRFIIGGVLALWGGQKVMANQLTARIVGFGLGSMFHLMCIVTDVFKPSFKIVAARIVDFFSNLRISVGFAFRSYGWDLKNHGFAFDVYFIIMATFAYIWINDLIKFIQAWQ